MSESLNKDEIFIVNQMIDGDKQAFKYFFDKYYSELCNFVNIYLKNNNLAEEVVQDIFVYFWENKSRINIKSSVRSYLFGASKYRSLNVLRQQRKDNSFRESLPIDDQFSETATDYFTDPEEFRKLLDDAVHQLPEKCKRIFLLSKQDNLSNKEIAARLGLSLKTVENQITIALKKLRSYLAPHREKIFLLFLLEYLKL